MTVNSSSVAVLAGAFAASLALLGTPSSSAAATRSLLDIYETIHSHPELSHHEVETSALLARELTAAGFEVTDHVGVYADGSRAYGVVGVLRNGKGPTLMVRADMDALPITEETGAPYASHVRALSASGQEVGVMHACGHDIHTTVLIGVARTLAAAKGAWRGTLMLVGQPSEETVDGARAMLADRLYERFGRPDMIIGLHDGADQPAGKASIALGPAQAGTTSVDVVIRGIGGHGALPQQGRDPVVLAALFITQLQTIASREADPLDPVIVTVGQIQGGSKRNIIPDEVRLGLTTRYFSDHGREIILTGLRRMAEGVALSAGLGPDRAPTVTALDGESAPPLYNDPALGARVKESLARALGSENVALARPITPSEDVGAFGLEGRKIPLAYFWLGAAEPSAFNAAQAAGKAVPGPHTSRFLPDAAPTLAAGVKALSAAALDLLTR